MWSTIQKQQISESYFQQILMIRHHRKMSAVQKQPKTNVKNNNSEKHKIQPATKINTLVFNNQPNICHWEGQESCKHENCKV